MPHVPGELGLVEEFKLKLTECDKRIQNKITAQFKDITVNFPFPLPFADSKGFSESSVLSGGMSAELTGDPRTMRVPLVPLHTVFGDITLLAVRTGEFLALLCSHAASYASGGLSPRPQDSTSLSWPSLADLQDNCFCRGEKILRLRTILDSYNSHLDYRWTALWTGPERRQGQISGAAHFPPSGRPVWFRIPLVSSGLHPWSKSDRGFQQFGA